MLSDFSSSSQVVSLHAATLSNHIITPHCRHGIPSFAPSVDLEMIQCLQNKLPGCVPCVPRERNTDHNLGCGHSSLQTPPYGVVNGHLQSSWCGRQVQWLIRTHHGLTRDIGDSVVVIHEVPMVNTGAAFLEIHIHPSILYLLGCDRNAHVISPRFTKILRTITKLSLSAAHEPASGVVRNCSQVILAGCWMRERPWVLPIAVNALHARQCDARRRTRPWPHTERKDLANKSLSNKN